MNRQTSGMEDMAMRTDRLRTLTVGIPFLDFLDIKVDQHGDELTVVMPFREELIGNPYGRFLHGGVTAAFLETAALIELSWGRASNSEAAGSPPPLPRTITFSVDYLRPGGPRDSYARARINRSGRRFASVHVEGWQIERGRLFAQATGHFLMPGA